MAIAPHNVTRTTAGSSRAPPTRAPIAPRMASASSAPSETVNATAERGATIHLVHVVADGVAGEVAPRDIFPPARSLCDKYRDICDRLSHLVPAGAAAREQKTELHVLESHHTAEAIAQAAERLSIDLICLGTHGRTGIAKAFPGMPIEMIAGGHDHNGDERVALDTRALTAALERTGSKCDAFAVASSFAVRNLAHEHLIREAITGLTGKPVTLSTELSSALDAPRRALTAALNARLISRISILIEAVGRPDEGIPPGTKWADIPLSWRCPDCGSGKEDFEMVEV